MKTASLLILFALSFAVALIGCQWLDWLVADPLTTLQATGEFLARTVPFWLALIAWIARGIWERARRESSYYDHTTTGPNYPRPRP